MAPRSVGAGLDRRLVVEGLTKRFGDITAIDDVSFEVAAGEVVGFLGPNGAGKTTTMRGIMRLLALDAGRVTWDGRPVDPEVRRRFGYMPAERGMYRAMRVRDHLLYVARLSGLRGAAASRPVDEWLERLGLTERAGDPVQSLSSGNQQRVQLALALLDEPELLVLDEPFAGLDPVAVATLGDILRERVAAGSALLLSSHQLDLVADVCTAVVIVDEGRVVLRGDVAELRAASPDRWVAVEFAGPVAWTHPGTTGHGEPTRHHRFVVERSTDPETLLRSAQAQAQVVSFTYEPPGLSEVFLTAVGRPDLGDGT